MGPATFYLIRHGETEWNASERVQGHQDIPLNTKGMEQALLLAEELQGVAFDAFYTSPLQRAYQTALSLKRHAGGQVSLDPRLKEACFGIFEGSSQQEYYDKMRELLKQKDHFLFWDKMHFKLDDSAESYYEVYLRAQACLDEIAMRHAGKCVAIVTHGGLIRSILSMIEQIDPRSIMIDNTGYVILKVEKTQYRPIQYCRIKK